MDLDLILLDVGMPGIEVLNRIIALQKGVPIVLQTACGRYRNSDLTWAADACLLKSSNLKEMVATVQRLAPLAVGLARESKVPTKNPMPETERTNHVERTLHRHIGESSFSRR